MMSSHLAYAILRSAEATDIGTLDGYGAQLTEAVGGLSSLAVSVKLDDATHGATRELLRHTLHEQFGQEAL